MSTQSNIKLPSVSTLLKAIRTYVQGGTLQKHVESCLSSGDAGYDLLVRTAAAIESDSPGKAGQKARNNELSALRTRMARACESLGIDPLTVRKVDKEWAIVAPAEKQPKAKKTLSDKVGKMTLDCDPEEVERTITRLGETPEIDRVAVVLTLIGQMTAEDKKRLLKALPAATKAAA